MVYMIKFCMVVAVAAICAYVGNRGLARFLGLRTAVLVAPWWEEACKLAAVPIMGAPLLTFHLLFGMVELGYDLCCGRRGGGLMVGLAALLGHALFGVTFVTTNAHFGGLFWAYAVTGAVHCLYNWAVFHGVRLAEHTPSRELMWRQ